MVLINYTTTHATARAAAVRHSRRGLALAIALVCCSCGYLLATDRGSGVTVTDNSYYVVASDSPAAVDATSPTLASRSDFYPNAAPSTLSKTPAAQVQSEPLPTKALRHRRTRPFVWLLHDNRRNATLVSPDTDVFFSAEARSATFLLDPVAIGRPVPTKSLFDVFRVDVHGYAPSANEGTRVPILASPRVSLLPNSGSYVFTLALPPVLGASAIVHVRLHQGGFHVDALGSQTCARHRSEAVQSFRVQVVAPAPTAALPLCGGPAVPWEGWYTASRQLAQTSALFKTRQNRLAPRHFAWTPAHCKLLPLEPSTAISCLHGRWLAFIGDSTTEELAITMALLLNGNTFDESWTLTTCKGSPSARMFDTRQNLPGGIRITMYWIGTISPCNNFEGTVVFTNATFTAQMSAFHASDMNGVRFPTIVANTGLHDLARKLPFTVDEYFTLLSQQVLPLLVTLSGSERIIWKSINPKMKQIVCNRAAWHDSATYAATGDAAVQTLNEAAKSAIANLPNTTRNRIVLLDEHALLLPMYDQMDYHHCTIVRDAAGKRSMNGVFSGCIATVQSLLSLLCTGADG